MGCILQFFHKKAKLLAMQVVTETRIEQGQGAVDIDGVGCIGIYIKNEGTQIVTLDAFITLQPGESFSEDVQDPRCLTLGNKYKVTAAGTARLRIAVKYQRIAGQE
jgi:hypothetical protein